MLTRARRAAQEQGSSSSSSQEELPVPSLIPEDWRACFVSRLFMPFDEKGPMPHAQSSAPHDEFFYLRKLVHVPGRDISRRREPFELEMPNNMREINGIPGGSIRVREAMLLSASSMEHVRKDICRGFSDTEYLTLTPKYSQSLDNRGQGTILQMVVHGDVFVCVRARYEFVGGFFLFTTRHPRTRLEAGMAVDLIDSQANWDKPVTWQLQFPANRFWVRHPNVQAVTVAVLMGLHPRLGANSPLFQLDKLLVEIIARMAIRPTLDLDLEEVQGFLEGELEFESNEW